jgi:hypothetical protein
LLTPEEKAAGRMFRALCQGGLDAENRESPPHGFALPYWRVVRHECEPAAGASIGITLREHRLASPAYRVCYCGTVGTDATAVRSSLRTACLLLCGKRVGAPDAGGSSAPGSAAW